ncbi:hypothetical protein WJX84_002158 [Apatococcus fuscideae]|uniref:Uncharacterized protein n=1 Tax=Apatococcus fuscideae TaxID=2026836 RepID=A0AAW1TCY5_9CHLO
MAFAGQGSTLQTHNVELVKCIEDLREKREEVHRQLMEEESERQKLTSELQQIQRRLNQINESITRKSATRNEYDKNWLGEPDQARVQPLQALQIYRRVVPSTVRLKLTGPLAKVDLLLLA